MKVPLSWLREYVAFDVPLDELAARLVDLELRGRARSSAAASPTRTATPASSSSAACVEAGKHPNADRLQLCRVDVGEGEPRQIVCGAWNFGAGATVAVALPGAVLPGGTKLEEAKLRGEVSRRDDPLRARARARRRTTAGSWCSRTGPSRARRSRTCCRSARTCSSSRRGSTAPTCSRSTASRARSPRSTAPSWRRRRASTRARRATSRSTSASRTSSAARATSGASSATSRSAPSPVWLKARLLAAGMRPISNVVDVTNYVMLALGNPLHAFDRAKLAEGRIVVRRAAPGEQIRTLDGAERDARRRATS